MENQYKRYLVTYTDGSVSTETAIKLLEVAKSKFKDGVSFLESESIPSENDVLHFESLGISSLELTEEEAEKIANKDAVLAVEEDTTMHALSSDVNDEDQFNELFSNSEELYEANDDEKDNFIQGYNSALLEVFAAVLEVNSNKHNLLADAAFLSSNPKMPTPKNKPKTPFKSTIPTRRQPVPWNISMVKATTAWRRGIRGNGIKVAILDTGIAAHPDLTIAGGVSFIPGSTSHDDLNSHGTHCAGIVAAKNNFFGIVGVAPKAKLYAVKVLDDNGSGQSSWIIAGMEWCLKNGIKVASMSLGGTSSPSVAYANAIKRCQDNGVVVVIASGNSYGSRFPWVCSPANSIINGQDNASPMAVGSINNLNVIAGNSSRGGMTAPQGSVPWNQVSCVAPGVAINSTVLGNGYGLKSGTSMACPHVAGLAALIIQRYPGISAANVIRRITTTCSDLGPSSYDLTFGYGLINCDLATR
jgi:subtilisin